MKKKDAAVYYGFLLRIEGENRAQILSAVSEEF